MLLGSWPVCGPRCWAQWRWRCSWWCWPTWRSSFSANATVGFWFHWTGNGANGEGEEDLLNSISIVMCNVSKTEKIIFPTWTWYPESAQQPDWTHQFQPSEWRWPDPWLFPEWPEAPPGGWTATCLPWVQSRGFNWLCILFTNMMHTNTLHVLINIVSLKQIHEQIVLSFLT